MLAGRLALFNVVDDHLHLVLAADRRRAGQLASGLSRSLQVESAETLAPARIRPVESRFHMEVLVSYILRQTVRHHIDLRPGAWAGSCLADLLGARRLPGFDRQVLWKVLPRISMERLLREVGLKEMPTSVDPGRFGPKNLLRIVAEALAIEPTGRHRDAVEARAAFAVCMRESGMPVSCTADVLEIPLRTAQYLKKRGVSKSTEEVIHRRLALEVAIANSPDVTPTAAERRARDRWD